MKIVKHNIYSHTIYYLLNKKQFLHEFNKIIGHYSLEIKQKG
jgi:hypothetical protein